MYCDLTNMYMCDWDVTKSCDIQVDSDTIDDSTIVDDTDNASIVAPLMRRCIMIA